MKNGAKRDTVLLVQTSEGGPFPLPKQIDGCLYYGPPGSIDGSRTRVGTQQYYVKNKVTYGVYVYVIC